MTLAYRIDLTPDDNGTFLVTCPALPEVTSFAEGEAEAGVVASDAIEEALAARIARSEDIPVSDAREGDGVCLPLLTELKVALYSAARTQGVTRADLVRRLDWNRESVDRLFRLDHNSRLQQIDEAYRALGLAVVFKVGARHVEAAAHV
ncbi:MAG: type II toxin-antitoxin system HicB family antitoxin [Caulobacterales bacterium]|jgi:antitoxin HicB